MSISMSMQFRSFAAVLAALALLCACAATPPKEPEKREAVFYPRPPDAPRIQHLATYASARDLETNKASSGLKDFLLGEDKQDEALVRPYGVAMFDGKIYVADSRAPGLAIYLIPPVSFLPLCTRSVKAGTQHQSNGPPLPNPLLPRRRGRDPRLD